MQTDNDISGFRSATLKKGWSDARVHLKQLEDAAGKMSSSWFIGNTGIIVAAGLFLLTAIVLGSCLARMLDHSDKTRQAQSILREEASLQDSLAEASAAARAFVIGRDPALLEAREQAKRSVAERLRRLKVLLADDPAAAKDLDALSRTIFIRLRLFDDMIAQSQTPGADIAAGEADRIRLVRANNARLASLRTQERQNLELHQQRIAEDMQLAVGLAFFAGIAAPLCGLIGIHLLRREREDQRARELQTELMHVQRLAIMGETSAMLAHEINQPLTAATNYLAVLRRYLDTGAVDKAGAMADRITQQIQRASGILRKLRRFIEKREDERSLEAPEILIDDAITLLGTIDSSIALNTRIGPDLPQVFVDRVQLQQVLVNLMRNAIEAMQDSPRHELLLTVTSPDRKTVEISLADSGPGLPREVADRLFQPFVSTKQSGMGVGLSICRSIVAQHSGSIWAEPNPDGGTVFRFTLPAAEERAAA